MKVLLLFLCLYLTFNSNTLAHPGKLDSNSGHTCYTNCEQYGLKKGQYHHHSGNEGYSGPLGNNKTNINDKGNLVDSFWKVVWLLFFVLIIIGMIMSGIEKIFPKKKHDENKENSKFTLKD